MSEQHHTVFTTAVPETEQKPHHVCEIGERSIDRDIEEDLDIANGLKRLQQIRQVCDELPLLLADSQSHADTTYVQHIRSVDGLHQSLSRDRPVPAPGNSAPSGTLVI